MEVQGDSKVPQFTKAKWWQKYKSPLDYTWKFMNFHHHSGRTLMLKSSCTDSWDQKNPMLRCKKEKKNYFWLYLKGERQNKHKKLKIVDSSLREPFIQSLSVRMPDFQVWTSSHRCHVTPGYVRDRTEDFRRSLRTNPPNSFYSLFS